MNQETRRADEGGLKHISEEIRNLQPNVTGRALSDSVAEGEKFTCDICRDAHIVHPLDNGGKPDYSRVIPCPCVADQLARDRTLSLLRYCELPVGSSHMTFENFKVRDGLIEAYELALKLANGDDNVSWLTFMGGSDRGKTHLAIAICRRWLTRGIPAKYVYVPLLFEELRRGFRDDVDRSYEVRFDRFLNVPLLILDDLGVEYRTPWVQEKLDTIIDYRLMDGLCTVVTSNTPFDELPFRIAHRLRRLPGSSVLHLDAPAYK